MNWWQQRNTKDNNSLTDRLRAERLRQAQWSFNLTLAMTMASTVMGLVGAGLLLAGRVQAGTIAATGSAASVVGCGRLAKEANDRLDQLLKPASEHK